LWEDESWRRETIRGKELEGGTSLLPKRGLVGLRIEGKRKKGFDFCKPGQLSLLEGGMEGGTKWRLLCKKGGKENVKAHLKGSKKFSLGGIPLGQGVESKSWNSAVFIC